MSDVNTLTLDKKGKITIHEDVFRNNDMFRCDDCGDEQMYIFKQNFMGYDTVKCIECDGVGVMI